MKRIYENNGGVTHEIYNEWKKIEKYN